VECRTLSRCRFDPNAHKVHLDDQFEGRSRSDPRDACRLAVISAQAISERGAQDPRRLLGDFIEQPQRPPACVRAIAIRSIRHPTVRDAEHATRSHDARKVKECAFRVCLKVGDVHEQCMVRPAANGVRSRSTWIATIDASRSPEADEMERIEARPADPGPSG